MSRTGFFAFSAWFLLQPFTVLTAAYLGILALDKMLAPILIVIWVATAILGQQRTDAKRVSFILIALAFFLVRNLSKIDNASFYPFILWEDIILFGYFCIPILYVNNIERITTASKLIAINAVVACSSAFLVAMGWLTLPYERSSEGRFDLAIQKSIGLYSSYGDVAQISAYFLLLALFVPTSLTLRRHAKGGLAVGLLAFAVVIIGLIGNQSRSMLLSLIVAVAIAWIFYYRSKPNTNKLLYNTLLFAMGAIAISFVAVVINQIISLLGALGGADASGTAAGRLIQYQYALELISQNPILGVDGSYYERFIAQVNGIHNMWLGQMARGGIITTLLLLWLLLKLFRISLRVLNEPETRLFGTVAIGYLFAVLVSTLFYPANSQFFWALLGMNVAIVTTLDMQRLGKHETAPALDNSDTTRIPSKNRILAYRGTRR